MIVKLLFDFSEALFIKSNFVINKTMHKIFSNTVIYQKPQAFYVKEQNSNPIPHHFRAAILKYWGDKLCLLHPSRKKSSDLNAFVFKIFK